MKKYAFVLGNNMALSITEVLAVFRREGASHKVLGYSADILFVECDELTPDFIKTLGGTIKIIEIFSEDESMPTLAEIIEILSKEISKNYISGKNKFHLGISIYDLGTSKSKMKKYYMLLRKIYVTIKKEMSKEGIKIAFPNIKGMSLSSASVIQNDLLTGSGAEYSLILRAENMLIGKTAGVQDIDFYTQIDVGRPVRDQISGTTPPKLATIMINLAEKGNDAVLLDPFCGSGTFLQQMLLAGYKDVYGSDISEKAMADTEENLDWLKNKFPVINNGQDAKVLNFVILVFDSEASFDSELRTVELQTRGATSRRPESKSSVRWNDSGQARMTQEKSSSMDSSKIELFISDVAEISKKIDKKADAIVTETYLGPPLKKEPSETELDKTIDLLTSIYDSAFREFGKTLNKNGRIVLAIPVFRTRNKNVYVPIEKILERNGFKIIDLCEGIERLSKEQKSSRNTFIYSRPDQLVRREILVLEKTRK